MSVFCSVYPVDPPIESRNTGEDGGFLHKVASKTRDKAGNSMDLPHIFAVLAVKGATRVALDTDSQKNRLCFICVIKVS